MSDETTGLVPIRVLHDFVNRVDRVSINYMLTGSMALAAYSIYRYTADFDVVIEINEKQVSAMVEEFNLDYYISESSVRRAVSSERMFNVIEIASAFKIDCVIRKSSEFQKNAFERRRLMDFAGKDVYVITCEDLILSKLLWASDSRSEKQMTDISNLLMTKYDTTYVDEWASKMGLGDLLTECRNDLKS